MRHLGGNMKLARALWRVVFVASALAVSGFTAAQAHTHLVQAVPVVGSTVQTSPPRIEISFSEAVEPAFSVIEVHDQKGERVDQGKPEVDPANPKVLRVMLKPLAAGAYKVVWRVVSVDTHPSNGSFSFTVAP